MTKTLVARRHDSPQHLLNRILDQPALLGAVQALPPSALLRLIDHIGLEDAGELGQGGLWEVLTSKEMLQAGAAADREDNRARAGFVATSSARSFLALARGDDVASLLRSPERDPITGAFFREYEAAALEVGPPGRPATAAARNEAASLLQLLDEVEGDGRGTRLLPSAGEEPPAGQTPTSTAPAPSSIPCSQAASQPGLSGSSPLPPGRGRPRLRRPGEGSAGAPPPSGFIQISG